MKSIISRITKESLELEDKIKSLEKFLKVRSKVAKLAPIQVNLMYGQLSVMKEYANILSLRLKELEQE